MKVSHLFLVFGVVVPLIFIQLTNIFIPMFEPDDIISADKGLTVADLLSPDIIYG